MLLYIAVLCTVSPEVLDHMEREAAAESAAESAAVERDINCTDDLLDEPAEGEGNAATGEVLFGG